MINGLVEQWTDLTMPRVGVGSRKGKVRPTYQKVFHKVNILSQQGK